MGSAQDERPALFFLYDGNTKNSHVGWSSDLYRGRVQILKMTLGAFFQSFSCLTYQGQYKEKTYSPKKPLPHRKMSILGVSTLSMQNRLECGRYFDSTNEDPPGGLCPFFFWGGSHRGPKKLFLSKFSLDRSFNIYRKKRMFL